MTPAFSLPYFDSMFFNLVLLFTVVPALELFLLFRIGAVVGGLNTFLIIIFTGVLGAALARSQGMRIFHNVQTQINKGEIPAQQMIQGLLVLAGGLLLLTPGFLTDILGFSMVLPGTRWIFATWLKKSLARQVAKGNASFYYQANRFSTQQDENFHRDLRQGKETDTFEAEFTKKTD